RGWLIANQSPLAVLCIEPSPQHGKAKAIVQRILATGRVWVAVAAFEGRDIIRTCVTNGETTLNDIDELVKALEAAGEEIA
ncbi:MAG TPA: hypothetical protein VHY56_09860, partial [Candidatus Binataceae bacterium]|nr:hypothetical protein [Candidatus Binataceae bacterium]